MTVVFVVTNWEIQVTVSFESLLKLDKVKLFEVLVLLAAVDISRREPECMSFLVEYVCDRVWRTSLNAAKVFLERCSAELVALSWPANGTECCHAAISLGLFGCANECSITAHRVANH